MWRMLENKTVNVLTFKFKRVDEKATKAVKKLTGACE